MDTILTVEPYEFPVIVTERYRKDLDIPDDIVIRERTTPQGRTYTQLDCDLCGWYTRVWWYKTPDLKAEIQYLLNSDGSLSHRCVKGLKRSEIIKLFKEINCSDCHNRESRDMYQQWWAEEKAQKIAPRKFWRKRRR
jgi:hypothetical protein